MGEDSRFSRDVSWGQQRVAANRGCGMHQDAGKVYRIMVRSELSERYAAAFEGMEMETKSGQTVLTGEVVDQVQLHGILDRIGDLGLELVSVQSLPEESQNDAANLTP
jgi:hypothetical protein